MASGKLPRDFAAPRQTTGTGVDTREVPIISHATAEENAFTRTTANTSHFQALATGPEHHGKGLPDER